MFSSAMITPLLFLAIAQGSEPIVVRAYPWAPFVSPMGEPFRGRPPEQAPIAHWFAQADQDKDGTLTAAELQTDSDRFFKRLDANQDGQIDPAEMKIYEWEIAPDVQVNSNWKRPRGEDAPRNPKSDTEYSLIEEWLNLKGDAHDGYSPDGLQGAARYGLLNIPQPVASADSDFNRAVTLAEFRQAAAYRFTLLDSRKLGRLTLAELTPLLPTRPEGRSIKSQKNERDKRIGLPLPKGD